MLRKKNKYETEIKKKKKNKGCQVVACCASVSGAKHTTDVYIIEIL